jgi:hypothetical protein
MIHESYLSIWFFVSGCIALLGRSSDATGLSAFSLAYPLSTIFTVVCILPFIVLGIELHIANIFFIEMFKLVLVIFLIKYWVKKKLRYIAVFSLFIICAGYVVPWITNDSAMFALYSKAIINGTVAKYPQVGVPSYGVYLPALNAVYSVITGTAFHTTISASFGLSLMAMIYQSINCVINSEIMKIRKSLFVMYWLFLITTPIFFISLRYVHSNLISAYFIFALFFLLLPDHKYSISKLDRAYAFGIPFLLIIGLGLARVENGLIIFALIVVMYAKYSQLRGAERLGGIAGILFVGGYYFYIHKVTQAYHDIILKEWSSLLLLLLLFVLIVPYSMPSLFELVKRWVSNRLIIILCILLSLCSLLCFPDHGFESLKNLFLNLFLFKGRWSIFWHIGFISIVYYINQAVHDEWKSHEIITAFITITVILATLVFLLGYFRTPFRLGYGDSANRLMLSLYPFVSVVIFHTVSAVYGKSSLDEPAVEK